MFLLVAAALAAPTFTPTAGDVLPVLPESRWMVLATDVPAEWAGKETLVTRPSPANGLQAAMSAPASGAPAAASVVKGASVTVQGVGGAPCTATITDLAVVRRLSWMEGYSSTWEAACKKKGAACDKAIAEDIATGSSERLLVGVLSDSCPVSSDVRYASTAPFTLLPTAEATTEVALQAEARLKATDAWHAAQADYIAQSDVIDTADWDHTQETQPATRTVTVEGRQVVFTTAQAPGCQTFGASAWASWLVDVSDAGTTWQLAIDPKVGSAQVEPAAVAVTPKGMWLLGDTVMVGPDGPRLKRVLRFDLPWIGCAC